MEEMGLYLLSYLDAILYLRKDRSLGERGLMSQERLERVGEDNFPVCVHL
jgi:hypothetical protein